MKNLFRRFFQFVAVIAALIILSIATFVIVNQFDETLNPEFKTFIAEGATVPDHENGFYALYNFNAPEGEDTLELAKKRIADVESSNVDNSVFAEPNPKLIKLNGPKRIVDCLLHAGIGDDYRRCGTDGELREMIADNALLLRRLDALYHYPKFSQRSFASSGSRDSLFQTQGLRMAQLVLIAEQGEVEQALASWIENMKFTQRLAEGQQTLVHQAIAVAIQRTTVATLHSIIRHATPAQLAANKAELDAIFAAPTFGKGGWDVAETQRAESTLYLDWLDKNIHSKMNGHTRGSHLVYLPNAIRNDYLEYAKDFIAASQVPGPDLARSVHELKLKYQVGIIGRGRDQSLPTVIAHYFYNPIGGLLLDGSAAGSPLLVGRLQHTAKLRLLKLYIEAKIAGIKAEDMAAFVANAPAEMQDPFTNKPFTWNAEKRSLMFMYPDEPTREWSEPFPVMEIAY